MGRTGKISSIKKEYDRNNGSLEASLAANGYSRFPGTGVRFVPAKEKNGVDYKTGLNVNSEKMLKMKDKNPEKYKLEYDRITKLKENLELRAGGIDLGPRSAYYKDIFNNDVYVKAQITRIKEGDNIFNLVDVFQAITYEWLKEHPLIASSYQAYERGEYPSNTQFYVNDENVEETIKYNKKIAINKAISTLGTMSIERRKKVARILGLPVSDSTKEETVYNLLDTFIKATDNKEGNPVELFNKTADMDDKILSVKDLVDQAIKNSIYRVTKGGRIQEGGQEIAKDKAGLVEYMLDDKNQDDLLELQERLRIKKTIAV